MTVNHKFGANCGRGPRRCPAGGAAVPAFVLAGSVIVATAAIAARGAIVSIAPAAAAIYAGVGLPVNRQGLTIGAVRATVTQSEGQGELLVTGEVTNLSDDETSTPNLRLALRGADGRELYVWDARPLKASLGARERVPFRARLAAPPSGVREVLVKFAAPGNKGMFTETPS